MLCHAMVSYKVMGGLSVYSTPLVGKIAFGSPVKTRGLGTLGNSWWACAARFFKSGSDIRPKILIYYTCFQTRTLKSIPVLKPSL